MALTRSASIACLSCICLASKGGIIPVGLSRTVSTISRSVCNAHSLPSKRYSTFGASVPPTTTKWLHGPDATQKLCSGGGRRPCYPGLRKAPPLAADHQQPHPHAGSAAGRDPVRAARPRGDAYAFGQDPAGGCAEGPRRLASPSRPCARALRIGGCKAAHRHHPRRTSPSSGGCDLRNARALQADPGGTATRGLRGGYRQGARWRT